MAEPTGLSWSVISSMEIVVDGLNITTHCDIKRSVFEMHAGPIPGTAKVYVRDLRDPDDELPPIVTGSEITLDIEGLRVWGGYVVSITSEYAFPVDDTSDPVKTPRYLVLGCSDYNILFSKRFIRNKLNPTKRVPKYPAGKHDDIIIRDLVSNYLDLNDDGLDYSDVTYVGTPQEDNPGSPAVPGMSWGTAMRNTALMPGAIYYIDASKSLVYADVDIENAPFELSDDPNDQSSFGYRDMSIIEDGTMLCNDAFVWGTGLGQDKMTFKRHKDEGSIGEHGLWQWSDYRQDLYRPKSVLKRATSYVDGSTQNNRGHKDPAITIRCKTRKPGLKAGMKVRFVCNLHGYDDIIPIRSMHITFVNNTEALYELVLAHYLDEAWNTAEFPPLGPGPIPPPLRVRLCQNVSSPLGSCGLVDDFDRTETEGWTWGNASFVYPVSGQPMYWYVGYGVTATVANGYGSLTLSTSSYNTAGAALKSPYGYSGPLVTITGYGHSFKTSFVAATIKTSSRFHLDLGNGRVLVNVSSGQVTITRFGTSDGVSSPTYTPGFTAGVEYGIELEINQSTSTARIWNFATETKETGWIYNSSAASSPYNHAKNPIPMVQLVGTGGPSFTIKFGPMFAQPCDRPLSNLTLLRSASWALDRHAVSTTTGTIDSVQYDPIFDNNSFLSAAADCFSGQGNLEQAGRTWITCVAPPETGWVRSIGSLQGLAGAYFGVEGDIGISGEVSCMIGMVDIGITAPGWGDVGTGWSGSTGVNMNDYPAVATPTDVDFTLAMISWSDYNAGYGYTSKLAQMSMVYTSPSAPGYHVYGPFATSTFEPGIYQSFPYNPDHIIVGDAPEIDFSCVGSSIRLLTTGSGKGVFALGSGVFSGGLPGEHCTIQLAHSYIAGTVVAYDLNGNEIEKTILETSPGLGTIEVCLGVPARICYETYQANSGGVIISPGDSPIYRPAHVRQLGWGTELDGENCTMASACIALDRQTLGAKTSNPPEMRSYQNDQVGGTDLNDAKFAWSNGFNETLSVHWGTSWASFVSMIQGGRGGLLQGKYSQIHDEYSSQRSFDGGHAMYINEFSPDGYALVYDPLAGGPRWMPGDMLRDYAEAFGGGACNVAYTRVTS